MKQKEKYLERNGMQLKSPNWCHLGLLIWNSKISYIYIYNVFGYFVKITEPTHLQEELVLPVFETRVERVALTENTYHILQNSWIKY